MNELNQCDGCMRGAPVRDGLHVDDEGHSFMVCTKDRYSSGHASSQAVPQSAPESASVPTAFTVGAPLVKRTRAELERMPKPQCPAELEVLSAWYFGKPLHLSYLRIGRHFASYEVAELYASYHGTGWLFSKHSIDGYDYSCDFWNFVIGNLSCGGIAGRSYGQVKVSGHRDTKRLAVFEEYLRKKESGRLRKPYERLARLHGAGENTVTRDSRVQTAGRVDGAAAVSFAGGAA